MVPYTHRRQTSRRLTNKLFINSSLFVLFLQQSVLLIGNYSESVTSTRSQAKVGVAYIRDSTQHREHVDEPCFDLQLEVLNLITAPPAGHHNHIGLTHVNDPRVKNAFPSGAEECLSGAFTPGWCSRPHCQGVKKQIRHESTKMPVCVGGAPDTCLLRLLQVNTWTHFSFCCLHKLNECVR